METKVCKTCNEVKPVDDFHFREKENFHYNECKTCFRKRNNANYLAKKELIQLKRKAFQETARSFPETKTCTFCQVVKPISDFYISRNTVNPKCRSCDNEKSREYRNGNRETLNQKNKVWAERHAAELKEYRRKPETLVRNQVININQRAKRAGVPQKIKVADRDFIYQKFSNKCLVCGSSDNLCLDHIISLSKGGPNTVDNLQLLCMPCNSAKRTKETDYRNI